MENQIAVKQQTMLEEVKAGLQKPKKSLPSKFFYDERGSKLFEEITQLEEYYPTRTEISIIEQNIDDIAEQIGPEAMLVELGSGSSRKVRLLLDRLNSLACYLPVDISEEYLQKVTTQLKQDYPDLMITPLCADYTSFFELPDIEQSYGKQVIFFPGSTIGNFRPAQAGEFLENLAHVTDDNALLLIGVDLKKERSVLEAAYNDEQGVTAEFNKNMLKHLNRKLGTNFNVDNFHHSAFYNEEEGRIEMHLVSEIDQVVSVDGQQYRFEEGESIHTENSYKYSLEEFEDLVATWFTVEQVWTDNKLYFSLQLLKKKAVAGNSAPENSQKL
ncbi:L-histidine N(alpha)-methyltransferase [Aliifodinibius sp. S!AR15-10]|uniref:L-histidine N(alpha)-methyltransferase n=1 Tax=Aliifodinibius sp. S!AR15-10 TaxID=2950437 RepID=UPI00285EECAB|nr:L-histidine N(alpha)-methyltransferase [Aliifodinibius sp. S!AR15-10]MDR8389711.1 L-histidine N(alpha)-methyltransferase [Aliifodinibius sp. S!AR15-10]